MVVDIPKDVTADSCIYEYPDKINMRSYKPMIKGHSRQIKRAADLIAKARKPMIYSGGGAILANASEELTAFVHKLGFPITNTLMGLGAFPGSDQKFVGMLGMHGTYEANMAMHQSDILIAIGARFDDRVTGDLAQFCPHAKIIHIDVDPASISKNIAVDIPIVGDVKNVLFELTAELVKRKDLPTQEDLLPWWDLINEWRTINCLAYDRNSEVIKPQFVIEKLYELTGGDAYITSDVGQHQMWAAQYYKFDKPRRWINSGGLGTMGFGLPAAMGVKKAFPEAPVACVTGDASIVMCLQELSTCLQYDLPLTIINLNNRYMGMVRQWQEFFYEKRYSHSYMETLPNFVKLAESYGHIGVRIEKSSEVEAALSDALQEKRRSVFIDVITDQTENVYPMIVAGKGHHEMHLSPDRELA